MLYTAVYIPKSVDFVLDEHLLEASKITSKLSSKVITLIISGLYKRSNDFIADTYFRNSKGMDGLLCFVY